MNQYNVNQDGTPVGNPSQDASNSNNNNSNAPEKKFSAGAISATVWNNKGKAANGDPTEFKTVSIQRSYTDKEGNWKNTGNFRVADLPKIQLVLSEAYKYLTLKGD